MASHEWIGCLGMLIGKGGPDGVLVSDAQYEHHVEKLIQDIQAAHVHVLEVLKPLGTYLTTEDNVPRTRAILFLAELIRQAPDTVSSAHDIHYLLEFFISRLDDWPALHGALLGSYGLFLIHSSFSSGSKRKNDRCIDAADAVHLVQAMSEGLYVRSLAAKDRSLAFRILSCAVNAFGQEILDAEIDLAEMIIVSIDGEKDPRCLLDGFRAAKAVLSIYSLQPADSLHLGTMEGATEEFFDVISCYFPVSFTPTPDDDNKITREDLAVALQETLLSWHGFGDMLIDLVEEKMSSLVKQAKYDSVKLLSSMASSTAMASTIGKEYRRIWTILRAEILPAAQDSKDIAGDGFKRKADIPEFQEDVLKCIAHCLKACERLGVVSLRDLLLNDVCIQDMETCIKIPGKDDTSFHRAVVSSEAASKILRVCGMAGSFTGQFMLQQNLPRLFRLFDESKDTSSACFCCLLLFAALRDYDGEHGSEDVLTSFDENLTKGIFRIISLAEMYLNDMDTRESWPEGPEEFTWSLDKEAYGNSTIVKTLMHLAQCLLLRTHPGEVLDEEIQFESLCIIMEISLAGKGGDISRSGLAVLKSVLTAVRKDLVHRCIGRMFEKIQKLPEDNATMIFDIVYILCQGDLDSASVALSHVDRLLKETNNGSSIVSGCVCIEKSIAGVPSGSIPEELNILSQLLNGVSASDSEGRTRNASLAMEAAILITSRIEESNRAETSRSASANIQNHLKHCRALSMTQLYANVGVLIASPSSVAKEISSNVSLMDGILDQCLVDSIHRDAFSSLIKSLVNKSDVETQGEFVKRALQGKIIGKALRGDKLAWQILNDICHCLCVSGFDIRDIVQGVFDSMMRSDGNTSKTLAGLFEHVLVGTSDKSAEQLADSPQVISHPLWRQKAYFSIKNVLCKHEGDFIPPNTRMHPALLGEASLISGAASESALIRSDLLYVVTTICKIFAYLFQSTEYEIILGEEMLEALLTVFKESLHSEKAKQEVSLQIVSVVTCLCSISTSAQHSTCRRLALECLGEISRMEYHTLHPHKKMILRAAAAASDDRKRAVRIAATQVRQLYPV